MSKNFTYAGEPPKIIYINSRKQRVMAVKAITVYLRRIRDAERRHAGLQGRQYEAEIIASILDDAVCILEALH